MKSIAIFNNKGGVGKTTLLCNLAAELAVNRGKRVLIVDADPQCNATQSLFSDKEVDSFYSSRGSFTIHSVIRPLSRGKGFADELQTVRSDNFDLDVVVGDPDLGLTEDLLATDWVQGAAGDVRGLRTTLLFSHLLGKVGDYDYVFFDMGPSLGSINRSVLLACDHFLTPISLDIFSLRAIENISKSLNAWQKKFEAGLASVDDPQEELEVADPSWHLDFVGYVTQQYNAKRDAHGNVRPVKAFEKISNKVPTTIEKHLDFGSRSLDQLFLGSIPTLNSLVPMSQTSRKPIFRLEGRDGVVGAHFSKVREFALTISGIADSFLLNVED